MDLPTTTSKPDFLSNSRNKSELISLLITEFINVGVQTKPAMQVV